MSDDPFDEWAKALNAPSEDAQHEQPERTHPLYDEKTGENGEVKIQIFPSPIARQSAAVIAGQYQALLDTGVFTSEQAFDIVVRSMDAVVIHHGGHDDDEDD